MVSNTPLEDREPLTQKNKGMLALVIFLGVLIVIATTVLIFTVVSRIIHGGGQTAITEEMTMPVTRPVSVLQEPVGTRITQVTRQSDQMMTILLTGGGQDRLVIWDIAHQRKISEIKLSNVVESSTGQPEAHNK